MNRETERFALFRSITTGFVLTAFIAIGAVPAHAADQTPSILADSPSMFTLKVINDTRSHIDSISIAPIGTDHWINVDFRKPMQGSSFDDGLAVILQIHDHQGCLRDLRTVLSDGQRIVVHNFDLCHVHTYRPGTRIL